MPTIIRVKYRRAPFVVIGHRVLEDEHLTWAARGVLGGRSTVQMVQRYAHLSADHLAAYADRPARPRTIFGTVGKGSARGEAPRPS